MMTAPKKRVGRPPLQHAPADTVEKIIDWISAGKTLREFCRQPNTPSWRNVYGWIEKDPEFSARFAKAREMGFDAIAEEALHIADTPLIGETIKQSDKGFEVTKQDMLGHRKLQVETRLKLLAKWSPKRYGELMKLAGDEENPLQLISRIERVIVDKASD